LDFPATRSRVVIRLAEKRVFLLELDTQSNDFYGMTADRNKYGKLTVGYFYARALEFKANRGYYNADEFKSEIEKSGVLTAADWSSDGQHKHTWRHRVDRVTQKLNTGI
jgi:hypothetical protein